jgi:serine/threonine protein phosphatase PrpC
MLDGAQVNNLHVSAASIIGASHLARGGVRQDAYNFVATEDGYLVVAIADGLGSRSLSQLGAALFCEGVTQAALGPPAHTPRTADELLIRGAEYAAAAAQDFYRVRQADIAFVAAVAVLGPKAPDGAQTAKIARVGDVSAFAADPGSPLTELFASDDGPINLLSESLPAVAAPQPQTVHARTQMLALVTDGLANDLRNSPGIRSWLSQQWAKPIGPFAFGDSLRYQRQGSHDDRTAVVVWQAARDPEEDEKAINECA